MGFELVHANFLLYCRSRFDADFAHTATLGRQALYLNRRDVVALFRKFGVEFDDGTLDEIFEDTCLKDLKVGFCEPFLHAIGAKTVISIDASNYENASIIHDMNFPVPDFLQGEFSALIDGGTLEHIFNFPVAIENCLKMIRPGGHFISVAPANNFFGHGFYQFSSELFYRVFCPENGFKVNQVFLCSEKAFAVWHEIPDPASLRGRVELSNQVPTFQLFVAEKIREDAGLHRLPQQSDYNDILWAQKDEIWTAHGDARANARLAFNRKVAELLPRQAADVLRSMRPLVRGAISPPFRHPNLRRFKV